MRGREQGQTSTEYMLLISVIVIAVTAAAYYFVPTFQGGVIALAKDTSSILATGQIGGIGMARSGGGAGVGAGTNVGAAPGNTSFRPNPGAPGVGNSPMGNGFSGPGTGYAGPLGPANSPPMPGTVAFDRAPRTGLHPMGLGPAVGAGPSTPSSQ